MNVSDSPKDEASTPANAGRDEGQTEDSAERQRAPPEGHIGTSTEPIAEPGVAAAPNPLTRPASWGVTPDSLMGHRVGVRVPHITSRSGKTGKKGKKKGSRSGGTRGAELSGDLPISLEAAI